MIERIIPRNTHPDFSLLAGSARGDFVYVSGRSFSRRLTIACPPAISDMDAYYPE
jgi:hypothetical protein